MDEIKGFYNNNIIYVYASLRDIASYTFSNLQNN